MEKKYQSYEDYFRLPNANNEQNSNQVQQNVVPNVGGINLSNFNALNPVFLNQLAQVAEKAIASVKNSMTAGTTPPVENSMGLGGPPSNMNPQFMSRSQDFNSFNTQQNYGATATTTSSNVGNSGGNQNALESYNTGRYVNANAIQENISGNMQYEDNYTYEGEHVQDDLQHSNFSYNNDYNITEQGPFYDDGVRSTEGTMDSWRKPDFQDYGDNFSRRPSFHNQQILTKERHMTEGIRPSQRMVSAPQHQRGPQQLRGPVPQPTRRPQPFQGGKSNYQDNSQYQQENPSSFKGFGTQQYENPEQFHDMKQEKANSFHQSFSHRQQHEAGPARFERRTPQRQEYRAPANQQAKNSDSASGKHCEENKQSQSADVQSQVKSQDEDSEEDTSFCKLCNLAFDSDEKFYRHTRGLMHTQRLLPSGQASQDHVKNDDQNKGFQCKLCNMNFDQAQNYYRHTRGLLHTQRQMAAEGIHLDTSGTDLRDPKSKPFSGLASTSTGGGDGGSSGKPKESSSKVEMYAAAEKSQGLALIGSSLQSDQDDDEDFGDVEEELEEVSKKPIELGDYHCEVCDLATTGPVSLRAHLLGRNHKLVQEAIEKGTPVPRRLLSKLGPKSKAHVETKQINKTINMVDSDGPSMLVETIKSVPEAIVGMRLVKEFTLGKQRSFVCTVCDSQCDLSAIQTHLIGSKHRMRYLKEHHPYVYEHVKSHGGKKSQLSAFLEEVCTDIEAEMGRGAPILQKPVEDESSKENEGGVKDKEKCSTGDNTDKKQQDEQEERASTDKTKVAADKPQQKTSSFGDGKKFSHEVVMARYHKQKRMKDFRENKFPQFGGEMGPMIGGGRPFQEQNPFMEPFRGREPGPERMWDWPGPPHYGPFGPSPHGPPHGHFPPRDDRFERFPPEDVWRREMHAFEMYHFLNAVGMNPEEERQIMFLEFERLGVPFEEARCRVIVLEERRKREFELIRDGVSVDDARRQVIAEENRYQKIQELEREGLTDTEIRWRLLVEEERMKLFNDFSRRGISQLEARERILSGQDRNYLIAEFERRGMPAIEARRYALEEEDRLRWRFEETHRWSSLDERPPSLARRLEYLPSRSEIPEDVPEDVLLREYLNQGLSLEDAKNKVIADVRRKGYPLQEAILLVEKVAIKLHETAVMKQNDPVPKSQNDHERKQQNVEESKSAKDDDNFDNLSAEEAKEKLIREYMKRGMTREEARESLINELILQGVSPKEARRRFLDPPRAYIPQRSTSDHDRPSSSHQNKRRYSRSNSVSSSSYSSSSDRSRGRRSRSRGRKSLSRSRGGRSHSRSRGHNSRANDKRAVSKQDISRDFDRSRARYEEGMMRRQGVLPYKKEDESGGHLEKRRYSPRSDRHERLREKELEQSRHEPFPVGPATLTLGEELQKVRMTQKRTSLMTPEEILAKYSRLNLDLHMTKAASQQKELVASKPSTSGSQEPKTEVRELLENLTNNLISSEDDASMALQVSKALTKALLRYRTKSELTSKSGDTPSGSQLPASDRNPVYMRSDESDIFSTSHRPDASSGTEKPSASNKKANIEPFALKTSKQPAVRKSFVNL